MVLPNAPIVNASNLYCNGLQLGWVGSGSKLLNIFAGECRDSLNINDITLPVAVQINGAVVGPNGVDLAPVVADSMYAVYVIASSESVFTSANQLAGGPSPNPYGPSTVPAPANPYPAVGLLSLNAVEPILPFGYDMYRRVGWALTDDTAALAFWYQVGKNDNTRTYYYDFPTEVLVAGHATAVTAVPLKSQASPFNIVVPAINSEAICFFSYTPNAAANLLSFSATAGTGALLKFGPGATQVLVSTATLPTTVASGSANVYYSMTAAGDSVSLFVSGFVDKI